MPLVEIRAGEPADRGASVTEYVGILALVAAVCASLLTFGVPGRTSGAVCRALHTMHLTGACSGTATAAGKPDPDEPRTACSTGIETKYLEETVTIPTRINVRTNSRNTLQLDHRVGANGKSTWEVSDFTWGEGGIASPDFDFKFGKFGIWGGGQLTNGDVYSFDNEKEARKFFDDLVDHRIGNTAKFVVRTNPLTSGFSWLVGKTPVVGKYYDRWIGGSEPDRKPSADYREGGLTGGFKSELNLWKVKMPAKARGWLIDGTRTDRKTGQRTTYYTEKGEAEAGVLVNLGDVWKRLPKGARERAAAGAADALALAMAEISKRIGAKGIELTPAQTEKIKAKIQLNPNAGLNFKRRAQTTWAYTEDKDGTMLSLTKTSNTQDILYFRADGKLSGGVDSEKGAVIGGKQWLLYSERTVTDKTLDYADPQDRKALEDYGETGDDAALDRYFTGGGGRMSRLTYDVTGDTDKLDVNWGGLFEGSGEHQINTLTGAQFYKAGQGWVPWTRCLG
ncbi:hypothetical protein HUT06_09165 [Actinomadura sp. NAK00032]|uniref:hypothetical protein n=1 Tax=Actinomadura sp. NAK00032 TaxID=2742128 RepID=UPI0015920092|nr:hypothetical protein [Actinomadura sp. NAK00032]QKW34171.1 hypothetical protein HUT06_09165 [Actinomadura sp. NAK00032]